MIEVSVCSIGMIKSIVNSHILTDNSDKLNSHIFKKKVNVKFVIFLYEAMSDLWPLAT